MSKKWLLISPFLLLAVILIALVAVTPWREKLQNILVHEQHEILATAEGQLLPDGSLCKVIKYRGSEGLYVEILKLDGSENGKLIDRILLPDKRDGLFNYHGLVTRLAITDIDGDGHEVLLAPTFDNQLVPHLNVFRYNPDTLHFELYQPKDMAH